jgi:hypothetical protein
VLTYETGRLRILRKVTLGCAVIAAGLNPES